MHIDVQSSPIERFREFFQGYTDEHGRNIYVEQVQKMSLEGLTSLFVNYDDLLRWDPELARLLREEPEETLRAADEALVEVLKIEDPIYASSGETFHVRFSNIPDQVDLRRLRSIHLGKLIAVEGIIIRQSVVKPLLVQGVFQCVNCGEIHYVPQEGGMYTEPPRCVNPNCGKKGPFSLLTEESTYTDLQTIVIQERPETLPPGQIPRSLPARLVGDLVDTVRAGDRAVVSGILRMRSTFDKRKKKLATFDPWLDVNFVSSQEKEFEEIEIDPETEKQILELSKDINIHRRIVQSIAPSIYGMEHIKEAIATVLFGGVSRVAPDGMKQRGESNLLIVGDPGVAKCVAPGTKVLLSDGTLRNIEEIVEEKLKENCTEIDDGYYAEGYLPIITLDKDGKNKHSFANIFWKRSAPEAMYKIKTKSGKEIIVTPTHPFFVPDKDKIKCKPAKDLELSDFIATPRIVKINSTSDFSISINGKANTTSSSVPTSITTELVSTNLLLSKKLTNTDIFWDKIIEIRKIKPSFKWVYDLQVPQTHNFIANNIYVHNSQLLQFTYRLAPRGLFTSGKASTAAGLCVSGDSLIIANNTIAPISQIVEREMSSGDILPYNERMSYKKLEDGKLETLCSSNLAISKRKVSRVWRIKSPLKLLKIRTKTGKELVLTKETSLLSIHPDYGLVWIPAKQLRKGDFIATVHKLPVTSLKKVPPTYELIRDYSKDITLANVSNIVSKLVEKICNEMKISKRDLCSKLEISEDTLYRWMKKERRGQISLSFFEKLCQFANVNPNSMLPEIIEVQVKKGQTIKLPKTISSDWFYILGLIIGDGSVYKDKGNKGYGGITISLSNRNQAILDKFRSFAKTLNLHVQNENRGSERVEACRIFSKLLYHIFEKFGLCVSPKPTNLKLNFDILFYPDEYLQSFLRGLFDSDGWVFYRDKSSGHIGFSSTSKNLIDFLQFALLRYKIVPYVRERKPEKVVTDTMNIDGKLVRYELTINNYRDIKIFQKYIGFNHPEKLEKLKQLCSLKKMQHYNDDNIPDIRQILNRLIKFYDISIKGIFGYHNFLAPSSRRTLSIIQLKKALENLTLDWKRHRIELDEEFKQKLLQELKETKVIDILKTEMDLPQTLIYEYFVRKGRKSSRIPVGILDYIYEKGKKKLSLETLEVIADIISKVKKQHEENTKQFELLKALSNNEIFWDKIDEINEKEAIDEKVYDLSVTGSHNFIVNGIVTHNTAAVVRDPDTGEFTLEAGALVLADRGICCLVGDSRVLIDNQYIKLEELFNSYSSYDAISNGEKIEVCDINHNTVTLTPELKSTFCTTTRVRRKYHKGDILEITFNSGLKIKLTPDHKLINGDKLIWEEACTFKEGDHVLAPLKIQSHDSPIYLLEIVPEDWIVALDTQQQTELRQIIASKYKNSVDFKEKFEITCQEPFEYNKFKVGTFKEILFDLSCFDSWKEQKFSFGKTFAEEKLKVSTITPELAYYLGFVFGYNGGRKIKKSVRKSISIAQSFSNNHIKQIKRIISTFSEKKLQNTEWHDTNIKSETDTYSEIIDLYRSSKLISFLYDYLTSNSFQNLLRLPDESLKAFFAGCMDSDGCLSIKGDTKGQCYSISHVELLANNESESETLLLALRRFDIYAKIKKAESIFSIQVTGKTDVLSFISAISTYSIKAKEVLSKKHEFSSAEDKLPQEPVANICKQIHRKVPTEILLKAGLLDTIHSYESGKLQPSRQQLKKIQMTLADVLPAELTNKIALLTNRDYVIEEIKNIKVLEYEGYVYDLYVPKHHSFMCNGIIVHNCIDEFDKMSPLDRSSIHEAMEQHSFHPSTEILLSDGSRVPIGDFVDDLFNKHSSRKVQGVNCEILDTLDLNLTIYSTDFSHIKTTIIDRVSRHPAPEHFIRISFENGRKIIVTPDHPVFVFQQGKINTIPASELKIDMLVPAPRIQPCGHNPGATLSVNVRHHIKPQSINFPDKTTPELARIIGYFVSKGYSHETHLEVGFTNLTHESKNEILTLIEKMFGINEISSLMHDQSITFKLAELYEFLNINFPEMMKDGDKRVPRQIFISGEKVVRNFLQAVFINDGVLETEGVYYRASSLGLAYDYQDLLLCLGIQTSIIFDEQNSSYKVYIVKSSINRFYEQIANIQKPQIEDISSASSSNTATSLPFVEHTNIESHNKFEQGFKTEISDSELYAIRVTNIEVIPNDGEYKANYVYDVTIEPEHCFISHGLILHNTVSIAKAGIVAQLNARTAIVAAANPRFGRYEDNRPPTENINLPPTILSRFDLIFVVRDEPRESRDREMARHILELRRGHIVEQAKPPIPMDLLRKYISYAKQHVHPTLTDEAMERIEEYYLKLRRESDESAIAITPRYLEALVRLSEAQARMALKDEVNIDHVEAAIVLLQRSLDQVSKNPVTGRLDIDFLTGTPQTTRSKMQIIIDIITEHTKKGKSDRIAIDELKRIAKQKGIDEEFVERTIEQLRRGGELYSPRDGYIKLA